MNNINKLKKILIGATAGAMILINAVLPVGAVAPWNITGNYQITFMLDGDPTPFVHHATFAQTGATVTGNGGYPATGGDTYHWIVTTGSQIADAINLSITYDLGAPGTLMTMTGTIASDGTVTGTWTDNFGGTRNGTWSITDGVSVPAIHTPSNNSSVTQSALVKVDWTDAVGSNPPFEYQYQAFSDADYTTSVYLSGWLSASEIPTPGTPPGDYYLRVRARDEAQVESAWSNGESNPYKITVTADNISPTITPSPTPVNAFDVPTECDQTIAYNLIEGTNGSEVLNGTNGPDMIKAMGGSDVVNGKGGNDCIVGGTGSDSLHGQTGNDTILGGDGSDAIQGDEGNDWLYGQDGSDSVKGASGNDSLFGGNGSDSLKGDGGTDSADGGANSDSCNAETEDPSCEA